MGSAKWIAGLLGWVAFGPIGALLGFFAGAMWDGAIDVARLLGEGASPDQTYRRSSSGAHAYTAEEQRNSFFVSLLVLSSAVIKADGKTHPREIDVVKDFIRRKFGDAAVEDALRVLERLNTQQVNIYEVGPQIDKSEKSVLEAIATTIGLSASDATSVIAMFYKDTNSAYSVLEIQPSSTDDEVRQAYRRMAMKNHPDKVATLGPEVQKAAEEKFRQIQEAYETIKKERGLH